jgi:hypothetical protein
MTYLIAAIAILSVLSALDSYLIRRGLEKISKNQTRLFRYIEVAESNNNPMVILDQIRINLKNYSDEILDPLERALINKIIFKLDSITYLLGTLDKSSPPEYVKKVINDVIITIQSIKKFKEE